MKVYTVMREYRESDILVLATASYEQALNAYNKQINLIDKRIFTNAIGVRLLEWEKEKATTLQYSEIQKIF
jgi:hypothetical protein